MNKRIKFITFTLALTTPFMLLKGNNNPSDYSQYISMVSSVINTYNYEEFYLDNQDVNDIINAANSIDQCTFNEEIDIPNLCDLIITNSINAGNSPFLSDYSNCSLEDMYIDELFRKCLFDSVNISLSTSNDIQEDYCLFKSLTFEKGDLKFIHALGLYEPQYNKITIDLNMIKENMSTDSLEQDLFKCLLHELSHVKQFKCNCRTNQLNHSIYSHTGNTILESSAESSLTNYYHVIEGSLYPDLRKYENTLFLMAAFKENKNIDQYYNAIFNSDLNSLFNFFGLDSEEKIKNFYNILYSLDTLGEYTELADNIKNEYGQLEITNKVGNAYKIDIFKIAVTDLIEATQRDHLSLKECLYLYRFVKTELYNLNKYYNDETFSNSLYEIEKIFYSFICDYYGVPNPIISFNDFILNLKQEKENENKRGILANYNEFNEEEYNNLLQKYPILANINATNNLLVNGQTKNK